MDFIGSLADLNLVVQLEKLYKSIKEMDTISHLHSQIIVPILIIDLISLQNLQRKVELEELQKINGINDKKDKANFLKPEICCPRFKALIF